MPICDGCGKECPHLSPVFDEVRRMKRLCPECFTDHYREKYGLGIKKGQNDIRIFVDDKYKNVPKINLNGEIEK